MADRYSVAAIRDRVLNAASFGVQEKELSALLDEIDRLQQLQRPAVRPTTDIVYQPAETINILSEPCPVCGCEAYDNEDRANDPNPTHRFLRRLAWTGKAIGVKFAVTMRLLPANAGVEILGVEMKKEGGRS